MTDEIPCTHAHNDAQHAQEYRGRGLERLFDYDQLAFELAHSNYDLIERDDIYAARHQSMPFDPPKPVPTEGPYALVNPVGDGTYPIPYAVPLLLDGTNAVDAAKARNGPNPWRELLE